MLALLRQIVVAKVQRSETANFWTGYGFVIPPLKRGYNKPGLHQSFHSLCLALPPCSGLRPETLDPMPQKEADKTKKPYPVRLSPLELEQIRANAEACALPIGTYMRECSLRHRLQPKNTRKQYLVTQQLIAELRRLGGLQKHLFTEAGGYAGAIDPAAFAGVLAEIRMAIRRIEKGSEA